MIHKDKTLEFIAYVVEYKKSNKLKCYDERYETFFDEISKLMDASQKPEDIYLNIGKYLSTINESCNFHYIYYREDCFEYLIENGYNKNEAFELMECIRKGKHWHKQWEEFAEKMSVELYDWAINVKYLPSRKHIFDCFYPLNDKFEYLKWE